MEDRAKEEVRMITETHEPKPLNAKIISELGCLKKDNPCVKQAQLNLPDFE